jgi:hypothetical protein
MVRETWRTLWRGSWGESTARRRHLDSTMRPRGCPKKLSSSSKH